MNDHDRRSGALVLNFAETDYFTPSAPDGGPSSASSCKPRFSSTEPIARVTISNDCRNREYELLDKGEGEGYSLS
jgi:hypothetical protein